MFFFFYVTAYQTADWQKSVYFIFHELSCLTWHFKNNGLIPKLSVEMFLAVPGISLAQNEKLKLLHIQPTINLHYCSASKKSV